MIAVTIVVAVLFFLQLLGPFLPVLKDWVVTKQGLRHDLREMKQELRHDLREMKRGIIKEVKNEMKAIQNNMNTIQTQIQTDLKREIHDVSYFHIPTILVIFMHKTQR